MPQSEYLKTSLHDFTPSIGIIYNCSSRIFLKDGSSNPSLHDCLPEKTPSASDEGGDVRKPIFFDIGSPEAERASPLRDRCGAQDNVEDSYEISWKDVGEATQIFLIRYDSLIAMTLVLGFDETTKEGLPELVEKAQRLLLQARRCWDIRFAHVKGHADIEGNVNADKNAEKGKTKGDFAAFSLVHRLLSPQDC